MNNSEIKKRRKILMLIPELGYGGAEKSFLRLSHLLSEHHEVKIAVFKRHYAKGGYSMSADEDLSLNITILDDEEHRGRLRRWTNRWKKLRALKLESDITISFLTGANILNVGVYGKSKTVVSMRGSRHFDPAFSTFKRILYEYVLDPLTFMLSDRIVSVSDGLSSELGVHVGKSTKRKIQTIEVFVEAEDLIIKAQDPIEEEIERLKGQPIISVAGRLSKEKGFQHLIPIFADIRRQNPHAKLVVIGDGPLYKSLIKMCTELNLSVSDGQKKLQESAVIFLGYRKDPLRYFRVSRVFVLSSLTEGFPNGVIEALSAGVPVVAADCPWGARSILSKNHKDIRTPYPTKQPTLVDYGMLMPRIDQKCFHNMWVDTLSTLIHNNKIDAKAVERVVNGYVN